VYIVESVSDFCILLSTRVTFAVVLARGPISTQLFVLIAPLLFLFTFRFVVDAADKEKLDSAKKELHDLISKPQLANIPLLVLGNKNDLPGAIGVEELIARLFVLARCATNLAQVSDLFFFSNQIGS
jgi:hypothetical protein